MNVLAEKIREAQDAAVAKARSAGVNAYGTAFGMAPPVDADDASKERSVTQRLAEVADDPGVEFKIHERIDDAQYRRVAAQSQAEEVGIRPTEFSVLIEPKEVETKIGSIIIPQSEQEKQKWATTEGTLIAASPLAFTYATAEEWQKAGATPPKPGDHILYAKYAGTHVKGRDGKEYVIAKDKDVMAVMTE